jgi:hypothetical protein
MFHPGFDRGEGCPSARLGVNIGQKHFNALHNFWKRKISRAKVEGWGYHGPDLKDFQPSLGEIDGNILD